MSQNIVHYFTSSVHETSQRFNGLVGAVSIFPLIFLVKGKSGEIRFRCAMQKKRFFYKQKGFSLKVGPDDL